MTGRDKLVKDIQLEIVNIGLAKDTEKIYRMILLNNVLKLVITGRSKFDIIKFLNTQSNRCGNDLLNVVDDVYKLIKDAEI